MVQPRIPRNLIAAPSSKTKVRKSALHIRDDARRAHATSCRNLISKRSCLMRKSVTSERETDREKRRDERNWIAKWPAVCSRVCIHGLSRAVTRVAFMGSESPNYPCTLSLSLSLSLCAVISPPLPPNPRRNATLRLGGCSACSDCCCRGSIVGFAQLRKPDHAADV